MSYRIYMDTPFGISPIAIRQQDCICWGMLTLEGLGHPLMLAIRVEQETDFILLSIDGPEISRLHLPLIGASGFDWSFIHGDDPGGTNGFQLSLVNGAQQFQGSVSELGQPGAADGDPVTAQTLMLAIEGLSSGAGESHPDALPELYVNLSIHTAPIIQPMTL